MGGDITSFSSTAGRVSFDFWGSPVVRDPKTGDLVCPGFTEFIITNSWDRFIIPSIGDTLPGKVEVVCHRYRDLDKKKKKGDDGARITLHGLEPANVEIQVTIWTPQQLSDLADIWEKIFINASTADKSGKFKIEPFDAYHPQLKFHDVKSIVFQGGEGPLPGSRPKERVFNIRAIEFIAQKKTKSKTTTPAQPLATVIDPNAPTQSFQPPGGNPANTNPL